MAKKARFAVEYFSRESYGSSGDSESEEVAKQLKPPSYWPFALSFPWLLTFFLFILGLIASLEVAARTLPMNERDRYSAFTPRNSSVSSTNTATVQQNERRQGIASLIIAGQYTPPEIIAPASQFADLKSTSTIAEAEAAAVAATTTADSGESTGTSTSTSGGSTKIVTLTLTSYLTTITTDAGAIPTTPDYPPSNPTDSTDVDDGAVTTITLTLIADATAYVALKSSSTVPVEPTSTVFKVVTVYQTVATLSVDSASIPPSQAIPSQSDDDSTYSPDVAVLTTTVIEPVTAYVPLESTSTLAAPMPLPPTTAESEYVPLRSTLTAGAAITTEQSVQSDDSSDISVYAGPNISAYEPLVSTVTEGGLMTPITTESTVQTQSSYIPPGTSAEGAIPAVFSTGVSFTTATTYVSTIEFVTITSTVVTTIITTTSSAAPVSSDAADLHASQSSKVVVFSWPTYKIFVGNYLPVLLAVIIKLFWTPIHVNAKMMQPFLLLARPEGALSRHVFFPTTFAGIPNPVRLFADKSWIPLCTTVGVGLVGIVMPLSSEAIFLDTRYDCPHPNLTSNNPCWPPRISADPYIIRVLQALLGVIAILCLCVAWFTTRSSSPLFMDPSSLAGVAVLMHHPVLLHDLRAEDPDASTALLKSSLPDRRYSLQRYQTRHRQWRYGIAPVDGADYSPVDLHDHSRTAVSKVKSKRKQIMGHGNMILHILSFLLMVGFLGLIVAYYKDGSNDGFNNFFNSVKFGPRFLMTTIAALAAKGFMYMLQSITIIAPFRHLSQKPQSASSTLLLRKYSLPHASTFSFARHGYIFPALFAFVAMLTDILVIFAACIPYAPSRVYTEELVIIYTSIGILSLMILATAVLFFWKRGIRMPRKPECLVGVMSYFCGSRVLDDIAGYGAVEGKIMEELLRRNGIRYGYGRFEGVDGIARWMVDVVR